MSEAPSSDFMAIFGVTVTAAQKLKKAMLSKGLTRAKAKCPRCGNWKPYAKSEETKK